MPYRPRPTFVVSQSNRDLNLMKSLHQELGVGNLRFNRNSVELVVNKLDDLLTVVIPHFDKYPLKGGKFISFLIFKKVCLEINNKLHLNPLGFLRILDLCYFIHSTSKRQMKDYLKIKNTIQSAFSVSLADQAKTGNSLMLDLSIKNNDKLEHSINIDYISGLFDGDGSINFSFNNNRVRVVPNFTIIADINDYSVLIDICKYFGRGKVYALNVEACRFQIEKAQDLMDVIEPIVNKMTLRTNKKHYVDPSVKAWHVIQKGIKTEKDLIKIVDLVYQLNQEGKYRKISKIDYLNKISARVQRLLFSKRIK